MTNVDIRALARLARLSVGDEEVAQLEKEIPGILAFVERVQQADVSTAEPEHTLRNVMRPDIEPHEGGIHTKELLDAAPSSKDDRIIVKQVVSREK